MTKSPEAHRPKQNGLQLLRIFAALLVLLHHARQTVADQYHSVWLWQAGRFGVDIFFVLSGYVMLYSSARLETMRNGALIFLQRRIARIVPLYWMVSTVALVSLLIHFHRHGLQSAPDLFVQAICSYAFVPYLAKNGDFAPLLAVGWTLNCEMFFYLLFAAGLKLRQNLIVFTGSVLACCCLLGLRIPYWRASGTFYLQPLLIEFVFGMLLARYRPPQSRRAMLVALPLLLLGLALLLWPSPVTDSLRPVRIGLPAALIVASTLSLEPLLHRVPQAILFFADATYALYLIHLPVLSPLVHALQLGGSLPAQYTAVGVCMLLCVVLSLAVHAWVELPLLTWSRKVWLVDRRQVIQVPA